MTTFVNSFSDLIALFLQALRLSVLLPAFMFVGLQYVIVVPALRETRLYHLYNQAASPTATAILGIILVILIAYILTALNTAIIRFFEGYFPLPLSSWLCSTNQQRLVYIDSEMLQLDEKISRLKEDAEALDRAAQKLADEEVDPHGVAQLKLKVDAQQRRRESHKYEMQWFQYNAELRWYYPYHQPWRVLPTRLGNIIAAAEEYPNYLYGIDAVTFWPYLNPILTKEGYASFIDREKSIFDFLLNFAVLALFFGAEVFYLDIIMGRPLWQPIAKVAVAISVAFCFYLLSLQGALSWGYTIRTAFVLYKDKLREAIGLVQPHDYADEVNVWRSASQFYRDHMSTVGQTIFNPRVVGSSSQSKDSSPT